MAIPSQDKQIYKRKKREDVNTGEILIIENITKFAREINVNPTTICHKINGRIKNNIVKNYKVYRK